MGPWHVKMPHKTCWGCDCCWCWCLETCWGQFVADLEAEVLVIKLNFCSDFEHKVWSRLKLRQDFEAEFWSVFAVDAWWRLWSFILVEILKLGLVKILKFKFSRNAEIWLRFWSWCLVDILEMKFDQNLCKNFDMTKEVILVSRTQPSSPLCFWQCLFLSEMWLPRRCFSHARDTCLVD